MQVLKALTRSTIMGNQFEIKETRYIGTLTCRKCRRDFNYNALHPQREVQCTNPDCRESQPYGREDNKEIDIAIESLEPHCKIRAFLSIDHEGKKFIPKKETPMYGSPSLNINYCKDIAREFLRKKGKELEEEDFWEGYNFVDDF